MIPLNGLRFYWSPPGSYESVNVGSGLAYITEKGPSKLLGQVNSMPMNFYLGSGSLDSAWPLGAGISQYPITANSHPSFSSQTTTTDDSSLIFTNNLLSAADPAFQHSNNGGEGTLVMWVWVAEECTNLTYLVGSSADMFLGLQVNSAGTHWKMTQQDDSLPGIPGNAGSNTESQDYPVHQWHCIAFSIEKKVNTDRTIVTSPNHSTKYLHKMYVNDEPDISHTTTTSHQANIHNFFSFQQQYANGGFRGLTGYCAVWDRPLTQQELTDIYNDGRSIYTDNWRFN